jgi:hypothetical protein
MVCLFETPSFLGFLVVSSAGILEQSMGIGLSYRPARLHRLAESIPWILGIDFWAPEKFKNTVSVICTEPLSDSNRMNVCTLYSIECLSSDLRVVT